MIDETKYTVYMHKNKINDKVYIGQTSTSVDQRWRDGKGYKGCTLFEKAINKYGWDNFEHIIMADNLTKEVSSQMEKDLITLYDSRNPQKGYNISIGGDSGHAGVSMSIEARRKIGESQKGKIVSQETRRKMSLASKGRSPSALALQMASKTHNIEVVQLTLSGEYVSSYCSSAEASRQTGINESTINACCNNRDNNKSAGGFLWMKESDYELANSNELSYKNDHFRPVVQLTKLGQYVTEFNTCKDAQKAMGKEKSNNINQCRRGNSKSAYGFIWIYKDEYNPDKDYTYKKAK
jgi:group I intron endonuclease